MKGIFITGTGTDIGKTYISGLLAKALSQSGKNVGYYKAAVSGNQRHHGELIPGDALFVKEMAGLTQNIADMVPFIYEQAYSPHLAAQLEGNPVDIDLVKRGLLKCQQDHDFTIMEGSGGILCPIRYDDQEIWLEDIIRMSNYPSVIVADAGLGTINHVLLTINYMKSIKLPILGIIYNNYDKDSILHNDNIAMIEAKAGLPTLARVCANASTIDIKKILELVELIGE